MLQKLFESICMAALIVLAGCAGSARLSSVEHGTQKPEKLDTTTQNIRPSFQSETSQGPSIDSMKSMLGDTLHSELDFSQAFAQGDTVKKISDTNIENPVVSPGIPVRQPQEIPVAGAVRLRSIIVPTTMVRVALQRNIPRAIVYFLDSVNVLLNNSRKKNTLRGRISVTSMRANRYIPQVLIEAAGSVRFTAALPCTLMARSSQNYFDLGEQSYRGSIIIVSEKEGRFSLINYCNVEDYLRGVISLEIGKLADDALEAVKAQAVAARTYTYKRISEKQRALYDMAATIEDQVYGGVNAEYRMSDKAVLLTRDLVITYGDSLIYAYYHSTCGGTTANIEDVWKQRSRPYLRSVRDSDGRGTAYCSISGAFGWEERWDTRRVSWLVRRFSQETFPQLPAVRGDIEKISIGDRFACGRVATCFIQTAAGSYEYGGDKIRYIFRRDAENFPILRSAHFQIVKVGKDEVIFSGQGNGHGVGLCQMGAIGRAHAGQKFDAIIRAYYQGTVIALVCSAKKAEMR